MAIEAAVGQYSLGRLVFALDERLRRRYCVFDYIDHRDCILRIQFAEAREDVLLADAWGRKASKLLDFSLSELSKYLAARPHLNDIAVIRAIMPLRGKQSRHIEFIAGRYGFESIGEAAPCSFAARLHRAGENTLGLMLTLASNPAAAHLDILLRGRAPLFLSRRKLDARYRACAAPQAAEAAR